MLNSRLSDWINLANRAINDCSIRPLYGFVTNVKGPVLRANYANATVGQICELLPANGTPPITARVIALEGATAVLSPFSDCSGLASGCLVTPISTDIMVPGGTDVLGRVLDGLGQPIDNIGKLPDDITRVSARAAAPDPMSRKLIDTPMFTGLKVIDATTTLGRGQRVGIFGPPGTGKTSLLNALAQHSEVDAIVIGMIGERGREVREFLDRHLPIEKRERVVVVVATSDRAAMQRVYAAHTATAIAESLRDEGKSVLLLMDSLTRIARALREVGLAAGEQPTRRGYPASVFPALPELIERAGSNENGDITAIYTVLVEGDGQGDPIAEEVKSLTDGHIVLSQSVAKSGRYPAIDIGQSISRVMNDIVPAEQLKMNIDIRSLISKYSEIEMLVQIGEYQSGSDKAADRAIRIHPQIESFFSQKTTVKCTFSDAIAELQDILR